MFVLQSSKKFSPVTRIVRREDYMVLEEASNIIKLAKEKRKKLLDQADVQIQLMKENVKAECDKMKKAVQSENERQCQQKQLEMVLSMLANGVEYFASLETTFVQVLKSLFMKILGEYPAEERMYVLVKKAIKAIPEGKFLHISVNPDQVILVKSKATELKNLQPSLRRIEVIANKSIPLDVCTLETETGIIDTGISVQLEILLKAVEASLH